MTTKKPDKLLVWVVVAILECSVTQLLSFSHDLSCGKNKNRNASNLVSILLPQQCTETYQK